jgi:hypothetical protein
MAVRRKVGPVHSHVFEGMEDHVTAQAMAAAEFKADELTAKMREPLGDVSGRAAEIEMNAPLFFGVIHPTLF